VEVVFDDFTVTVVVVIVSVVVTVRVVVVGADSKVLISVGYGAQADNSSHVFTALWFDLNGNPSE
jgi:hypothetical protein